jgi:hypothetical protein
MNENTLISRKLQQLLPTCQTEGLGKEDAELLVYLVNEEMDIYIGIRRCLPP